MSKAKTKISNKQASSFLSKHLGVENIELLTLQGGEIAQAYRFNTDEGDRVVRFSKWHNQGFLKDRFADDNFSVNVPIPHIFEVGEVETGLYYAISEYAAGKPLSRHSELEIADLMPEIIDVLDAIHSITPPGQGYGWWRPNGEGKTSSWKDEIIDNLRQPDDYLMRSAGFFDGSLHETLIRQIEDLINYCPNERSLVHSDFGSDNVIAAAGKITGVLDWEHSVYGDPLYDIAWLQFWGEEFRYEDEFKEHYASQDRLPDNYDQRLACYKLNIGHGALCFFAKSDQPKKYQDTKNIINRMVI